MSRLFCGIDCSTQSCKLVILDLDLSKILYTDLANYDKDLPQYNTLNGVIQDLGEGISESDPQMWIGAIELLFDRLKKLLSLFMKLKRFQCPVNSMAWSAWINREIYPVHGASCGMIFRLGMNAIF